MLNFTKPFYPLLLSAVKSDPETAHRQMLKTLHNLELNRHTIWGSLAIKQLEKSLCVRDARLQQTFWGLDFNNPLGLAAGFDKDGTAAGIWSSLGFGFAELGAVTLHSQPGNPRPRLFRLPEDKAALNRMGANNLGAAVMADTLAPTWQRQPRKIPIGINLCKSKNAPLENAAEDYVGSFKYLQDVADYFVINVSSPNTPGLRSLQGGEQLEPIDLTQVKYIQKELYTPVVFIIYKDKALISIGLDEIFIQIKSKNLTNGLRAYADYMWKIGK